jgi:hypothetical protein
MLRHSGTAFIDNARGEWINGRGCRTAIETPLDVLLMTKYLLLAFEPERHLGEFILEVGGAVCVLCKVDMETFGVFTIGVVGGTEEPDVHGIM